MKKQDFLKEVLLELNTIKEKATLEEINKLNFQSFDFNNVKNCIYGQMTGDCNSKRAKELCSKTYGHLGGKFINNFCSFSKQKYKKGNMFTSLEKYLYMVKKNKHSEIIDYLKGNLNEIKL